MSITNKLTYLEDTKTQIKEAIKAKGVEVSDNDTFRSYASKIGDIQTGGSGSCVASVCFDDIGYTTTPQYMVDGVAYALQIKNTWDASITIKTFSYDERLIYFPPVDVSNINSTTYMFSECRLLQYVPSLNISSKVKTLHYMFKYCNSLVEIKDIKNWDVSNATRIDSMFDHCESLKSLDLSGWNTNKVTNMDYIFSSCSSLTSVDLSGWNTSNVINMGYLFSNSANLEKIDGVLDITSCNYSNAYSYFPGFAKQINLRKITYKNLGYQSAKTGVNFSYIENWGVNNDTITDARQSLIDSLVTYTFDRASAGYATHTITLSANTKAVLTEEEIAQITAKGYTIA